MTLAEETELIALLRRVAVCLERFTDYFAPQKKTGERKPAILGTATYTREERERKELRAKLSRKKSNGIEGNQAG